MTRKRRKLLDAASRLIDLAHRTRNPAWVTGSEAARTVAGLEKLLKDASDDLEAAVRLGRLSWYRHWAMPPHAATIERSRCITAFAVCFAAGWDGVPTDVLPAVVDHVAEADAAQLLIMPGSSGTPEAFNRAIALWQRIHAWTPRDHPDRVVRLVNFGAALRFRYDQTGDVDDLAGAIALLREAAEQAEFGDEEVRYAAHLNLWLTLQESYRASQDPADLDAVVEAGEAVLGCRPAIAAEHWHNLNGHVLFLETRHRLTRRSDDRDTVIDLCRRIRAGTPRDAPDRADVLVSLVIALQARYEACGADGDLDEWCDVGEELVALLPVEDLEEAAAFHGLAAALLRRFELTHVRADVDRAIELWRQEATKGSAGPAGTPTPWDLDMHVALALHARFQVFTETADLDEALALARAALTKVPDEDPFDRVLVLNTLGLVLRSRFETHGAVEDRDESIAVRREAVARTPPGHPMRSSMLSNLGMALSNRILTAAPKESAPVSDAADEAETLSILEEVSVSEDLLPRFRIEAAYIGAGTAARQDPAGAAHRAAFAVRLLADSVPARLTQDERLRMLAEFAGLPGDAAALALEDPSVPTRERPLRAVQLLEQGRAVLLRQAFRSSAHAHRSSSARSNSAFDGLTEAELRAEAADGAIVMLNFPNVVASHRCDALLITRDSVDVVPLPGLSPRQVLDQTNLFQDSLDALAGPEPQERARAQKTVLAILAWLWTNAAEPILERLGHGLPDPTRSWPRIWWVPCGPFGLLPLHAAGLHLEHTTTEGAVAPPTVMDRVVSSYTPTIHALREARRLLRTSPAHPGRQSALIVGMSSTPELRPLEHAAAEAQQVRGHFTDAVVLDNATRAEVLANLPGRQVFHFAGHGGADSQDPSRSRLFLHDHLDTPLTVADLMDLRLSDCQFAYLSACQSAVNHANRLLDEALQITSALHIAGFPRVVGALWEVGDEASARMAEAIYRTMAGDHHRIDFAYTAEALNLIIRTARDAAPALASEWSPYIHVGA